MKPEEYLAETQHAVLHFYAGLDSCWEYYKEALSYWDVSRVGLKLSEEEKKRIDKYLQLADQYFSLDFSEGTFAGAILQVAATGIRLFSPVHDIPPDCAEIVSAQAKGAIPFCVGERLYGLPIGLIIYAGRNQYVHWESDPYEVTTNIFNRLTDAFYENLTYDLAFDLGNPTIYANEILLGALRWNTYNKYLYEMKKLLGVNQ